MSQGGLLDVVADRNFADNKTIYFCFAEPSSGGGRTALARATLGEGALDDVKVIFEQKGRRFGRQSLRLPHRAGADGNLFLTIGEHFTDRDEAQKLTSHLGKIMRIAPGGSVPRTIRSSASNDARPEIWSLRPSQRARRGDPSATPASSGSIEHGAKGGDEVNIPQAGKNYGWPVISHGVNYDGPPVGSGKSSMPGMEQPIKYWVPSIAPSGMAFYTGDLFPAWKGSLFVGALAGQMLVRLDARRREGRPARSQRAARGICASASATCAWDPTARSTRVTDNNAGRVLKVVPAK